LTKISNNDKVTSLAPQSQWNEHLKGCVFTRLQKTSRFDADCGCDKEWQVQVVLWCFRDCLSAKDLWMCGCFHNQNCYR